MHQSTNERTLRIKGATNAHSLHRIGYILHFAVIKWQFGIIIESNNKRSSVA